MAQRVTNTYVEWLTKLHAEVAKGKQLEDAIPHLDFITNLETAILGELHQPVDQVTAAGASSLPNPGPPAPSGPGAGMPMGPPPAPPGPPMPAPMGGAMPGVSGPNPDELRRILAQSGPA